MNKRAAHLAAQLHEMAEDPEYHPITRQILQEAAQVIVQMMADTEALIREGSDHD